MVTVNESIQKAKRLKSGKKNPPTAKEKLKIAQQTYDDPWTQAGEELATDPRIKDTRKTVVQSKSKSKPKLRTTPKTKDGLNTYKAPKSKKKTKAKKPLSRLKQWFKKIRRGAPDLRMPKSRKVSSFKGTAAEYADEWARWHKKYADTDGVLSKAKKYDFYEKVGVLYTEEGFKIKPNQSNRKNKITGEKIDNWSNTLDGGKADLRQAVRNRRETVLTYMFGGDELDITKAADNARDLGLGKRTAHHIFGGAEFAPFIDDIVAGLMAPPGSETNKWARWAADQGRNHFRTSQWFAGNTAQAYRMLTDDQHVAQGFGNLNVHQEEAANLITRTAKGGSRIGWDQAQGTVHGIPTDEYISRLPLKRQYRLDIDDAFGPKYLSGRGGKYVRGPLVDGVSQGITKGLTRWDALEIFLQESLPIRDEITQMVMKANPAKGDVLPNVKIGEAYQEYYGVNRYGDPNTASQIADDQILRGGRPQSAFRSLSPDGMPYDASGMRADFSPTVNSEAEEIFGSIDRAQVKGANIGGNVPTSVLRARAKHLALLGLAGVSVLGTGASAAETAVRTDIASKTGDWRDKAQAGISGFSLANDVASYSGAWALPGAILSMGADGLNWIIDDLRR